MKNVEDIYRLSPLQAGILFHSLASPDSPLYFEQYVTEFEGELDADALRRAWTDVVAAHPALRTAVVWEGLQEPLQVVARQVTLPWTMLDWSDRADAGAGALEELMRDERARPFVLTRAPLMRLTLVRLAAGRHVLVWNVHHVILDGWSCALVRQEVAERYRAACGGRAVAIAPRTPFVQYVRWLERQDVGAAERFWRGQLAGASRTPLPLDSHAQQPAEADGVAQVELLLSSEATARVQVAAREHQITLNTVCLAAWALLLARRAGTDDVLFGATVAGRPPELPDVERMIGLFINTVPVRVEIPAGERVHVWLRRLQGQMLETREYEYAQLADVQRWSGLPSGAPLFDSLVVYENYPGGTAAAPSAATPLRVRPAATFTKTNYPLTLIVRPGLQLQCILVGDTGQVGIGELRRMLARFGAALEAVTAQMRADVSAVSFLTSEEEQQDKLARDAWAAAQADAPSREAHGYVPPRDGVELELVRMWEKLLGAHPIGIRDTFAAHGGHSILLLRLASQIEARFRVRLPLVDLVQDATIEGLASLVGQQRTAESGSRLVSLQGDKQGPPLVGIVPAGGTLACYLALAERLGSTRAFHALQPRASFEAGGPQPTIEDIARDDVQELRRAQPHGPYALVGWSMGALVAYEMARQLHDAGEEVGLLALLDAGVPDSDQPARDASEAAVQLIADRFGLDPTELGDVHGDARIEAMLALAHDRGHLAQEGDLRWVRWLVYGFRTSVDAGQRYRPQPYDGRVVLIRAVDGAPPVDDPTLGWGALARGGVEVHALSGTHQTLVQPPYVNAVADCLRAHVDNARANAAKGVYAY